MSRCAARLRRPFQGYGSAVAGELIPGSVRLLVQSEHDLKTVRDSLRWLPLPRALVADVVLAASELVTNALQYADGWCEFSARYPTEEGAVRVEVSDNGPLPPPLAAGTVDARAAAGRGLHIVDAVVTRWGVEQTSPDSKTIWFEMDTGVGDGMGDATADPMVIDDDAGAGSLGGE